MKDKPHIVIVDDHREIRDLIGDYLTGHGYRVSLADGGDALRKMLKYNAPDLILLDVMMPGEDGLEICRNLRSETQVPVIFLTALAEDTDRILGLEMGADDYVVKPFNPREVLARIRAVLRRVDNVPFNRGKFSKETIRFDQWTLDLGRRELERSDGLTVALSTVDFRLLKVFLENPKAVLTREKLLDLTVGKEAEPFDRSIDNQVSRLRKKIEANPKNPRIIQTHWGGGYSLGVDVEIT
ncbi:response regulator [Roseibium aggregatum]|uniref:response regulator n=1 Tax=Roseibium aggregatum TaxID=187304 RepID=UPI001A90115E|nr:response regulator [Roseibium aggregatum]MBN8183192.1 response regulator [Roseibium aggregatum]UES46741.1 response regulator [Roseibium aggregatum]